jgi:hypothetical protein
VYGRGDVHHNLNGGGFRGARFRDERLNRIFRRHMVVECNTAKSKRGVSWNLPGGWSEGEAHGDACVLIRPQGLAFVIVPAFSASARLVVR